MDGMKECSHCGLPHDGEPEFCRNCWYGGVVLASNLAPVIDVLEQVTGVDWYADHTGGGCAALVARADGGDRYDEAANVPVIMVTQWPDVLSLGSTLTSVRKTGWFVGAYADWWEGGVPIASWPDRDDGDYGLHDEELPMAVVEAQRLLLNTKEAV